MKQKTFAKKAELLNAALDEFTKKTYEDASLNRIIKNAGISKGTFYYHFKDKQTLYLYLLEHAVKAKWEFIERKTKEINLNETTDIFELFRIQAAFGIEFAKCCPQYHKLGTMFAKEKGKEIYDIAIKMLGDNPENLLKNMIDKAIADRNFREDLPEKFIHKIISYLFIHFTDIFQEDEDFEIERMLENVNCLVDFLRNGLGK
ncbi:TetR/AcrR family transcriptional regulator [Thermoactinomyces mirandus]|uniref:TetR/AcrR family transcriptional regulator n=1 Tax=Thermoactinomyces mirandus TaxID=2756294 RepID=A0A7W1XTR4_9BACL|nr:TetR/AcrR family transcriptional regulator [Thermoactinomyces mirandus]MBA4603099.1 TetR/AcrR family transcriptional regulator [Thermoactinomyces mirandus]